MKNQEIIDIINKNGLLSATFSIKKIWVVIFLSIILNIVTVLIPFFIIAVSSKLWNSEEFYIFLKFGIGIFLAATLWIFLASKRDILLYKMQYNISKDISNSITSAFVNLPYNFIAHFPVESQLFKTKTMDQMSYLWISKSLKPILDIPLIIGSLFIISYFLGIFYFLFVITIIIFGIFISFNNRERVPDENFELKITGKLYELFENRKILSNIKEAKIFIKKIKASLKDKIKRDYASSLKIETKSSINESLNLMIYCGTLFFSVYSTISSNLSPGSLVIILLLTWFYIAPLSGIIGAFEISTSLKNMTQQINRLINILPMPDRNKNPIFDKRKKERNIIFNNVSFSYPGTGKFMLKNISLKASIGEAVFIYGSPGSGKTTLFKILGKLHEQQAGAVLINQDIKLLDTNSIRKEILFIPEKNRLLPASIYENILLDTQDVDFEKFDKIVKKLGIDSEIKKLDKKYDTIVDYRTKEKLGEKIVLGIILARILVCEHRKIILFDEPLEIESIHEHAVEKLKQFINEIKKDRVVIIASNKEYPKSIADRIYVIEEGGVVRAMERNS
jgi:ABC-type bacteriocin/lantibiotic exporter with double-glycine peptidase domain